MKKSFSIGSTVLANNILYAPLAGCSDFPFRQMSCFYRPGIVFCEMVKIDALVRHDPHTYRLLDYAPSMHPIGAQLCGSKPKIAATAARIIEDLGFDILDLNCGCPVDKVTKDGSGSGMLKNPQLIGEILSEIVAAVKIPVTIKIRAGWDEQSINSPLITQIAERAGAKAIAIHGRTRAQGYKGSANWDYIKACKDVAKDILVIGNGDIFNADAALSMFSYTNCDAILISRGTMGQPWIVQDILRALDDQEPLSRTPIDIRNALFEHFSLIVQYQSERQALLDFRRVGCWYLKRCAGSAVKNLREQINRSSSPCEALRLIESFPWEEVLFAQNSLYVRSEA